MSTTTQNEWKLIASEFATALELHFNDAAQYCRALCANWSPDEAEDVLQQALLKALKNYSGLADKTKFKSWLFRVITNTFYNEARGHFWKRFLPFDAVTDEEFPAIYTDWPDSSLELRLHTALSLIKKRDRAAILLYEIAGFSISEIAEIQNDKSLSAVKSRLSRARVKLKSHFESGNRLADTNSSGFSFLNIRTETLRLIEDAKRQKRGQA